MRSFTVTVLATALVLFCSAGVAAAAPPDYCAELKGANTGSTCEIQMADAGYNLDISFPLSYPDGKPVADFITKERDDFLNVAKSSAPRDQPYQLTITSAPYGSAIPPRGTEAVVFKVVENIGAGHPKTTYKSFNWDQSYRKEIVWTAAPDDKSNTPLWRVDDPLKTVAPIVQSELQKQTAPPVSPMPAAPPVSPTPTTSPVSPTPTTSPVSPTPTPTPLTIAPVVLYDPANYQNFAVTNDGVIFFFDQGKMLSDAAGAIQVLVPRSAIDPMIA
jgi:hypothetical protein